MGKQEFIGKLLEKLLVQLIRVYRAIIRLRRDSDEEGNLLHCTTEGTRNAATPSNGRSHAIHPASF